MGTMKKGRISKEEERYIKSNIDKGYKAISKEIKRDPESLLNFIRKKVAEGDMNRPSWMDSENPEEEAKYGLTVRPYWAELQKQFTEDELKLFQYHWARIISQFKDDVIPTEEMQVVDLIKLELLMNRSLQSTKQNVQQVSDAEAEIEKQKQLSIEHQDVERIMGLERLVATLRASMESLNKDYRDLQTKKNSMLKEMKATREQRVKRLEDSKHNFSSWLAYLATNPEMTKQYGAMMEKMRLSMEKERERLSEFHKYNDELVDQPFLTPDTVKDD
jgi:hypothetical protein